jgi:hypothetical protein
MSTGRDRSMNDGGGDGPRPARVAASSDARRARPDNVTADAATRARGSQRRSRLRRYERQRLTASTRRDLLLPAGGRLRAMMATSNGGAPRSLRLNPHGAAVRAETALGLIPPSRDGASIDGLAARTTLFGPPKQGGAFRLHEPTPSGGARKPETDFGWIN